MSESRVPLMERRKTGPVVYAFTSLAVGIVLLAIAMPGCVLRSLIAEMVASDRARIQVLSSALETYFTEHGTIPPAEPWHGTLDDLFASAGGSALARHYERGITAIGVYWRLAQLLILGSAMGIWAFYFRRARQTSHATTMDAVILWVFAVIPLLPISGIDPTPEQLRAVALFFALIGTCVWWGRHSFRTSSDHSTARVHLIALILPIVFIVQLASIMMFTGNSRFMATRNHRPLDGHFSTDGKTFWVVQLTGPATRFDGGGPALPALTREEAEAWFDGNGSASFPYYDPTNGTMSSGDIFRSGP